MLYALVGASSFWRHRRRAIVEKERHQQRTDGVDMEERRGICTTRRLARLSVLAAERYFFSHQHRGKVLQTRIEKPLKRQQKWHVAAAAESTIDTS